MFCVAGIDNNKLHTGHIALCFPQKSSVIKPKWLKFVAETAYGLQGVSKQTRISSLSCDKTEFEKAASAYRDKLESSGFNQPMEYTSNSPPPPTPPHAAENNREERDPVKSFVSTLRVVKV